MTINHGDKVVALAFACPMCNGLHGKVLASGDHWVIRCWDCGHYMYDVARGSV